MKKQNIVNPARQFKSEKAKLISIIFLFFLFNFSFLIGSAQSVAINPTGALPNASALLDIDAAPGNNKGMLIPRVPLTQTSLASPITSPATSLLIYNTASVNDVTPGYYYWDGTKWERFLNQAWVLTGNAGTTTGINFLGTTDAKDLVFKTNNTEWVRIVTAGNVGIGTATPNSSAKVDITSTTQGFAMPRMTTVQRLAIANPTDGLMVYDTDLQGYYNYGAVSAHWDCVTTPAGTINYFANTSPPRGYLECNGQSVSAATYPELFNAIGYTYGGSGANFNVPELRGEFVRGVDNGRGVDVGRVLGSFQPASTHKELGGTGGVGTINDWWSDTKINVISDAASTFPSPPNGGMLPGGAPNNPATVLVYVYSHRPRNIALLPCIKF